MKVLVHLCCGPCAIAPVQALHDVGVDVVGLYYNPNIHPLQEYLRRREGVEQVAQRLGISVIYKDEEYDPALYFRAVTFRESQRCAPCYALRLERTLSIARHGRFDAFTTTLLYSKFQKHDLIRSIGEELAQGSGPDFLYQDFRTGWSAGITQSKAWGVYRQQYCGCLYSEGERYDADLRRLYA
ncbi:epoxyqueuosine reductase QueH [Desulfovibrionales bacterium]